MTDTPQPPASTADEFQQVTCPRCGEWRLVELLRDVRGIQAICSVCAHEWWIRRAGHEGARED